MENSIDGTRITGDIEWKYKRIYSDNVGTMEILIGVEVVVSINILEVISLRGSLKITRTYLSFILNSTRIVIKKMV